MFAVSLDCLKRCFFSMILIGLAFSAIAADQPSTEPFLRIETGMHTSMIRRILVDEPRQRLFTCSDDKTIRVWKQPGLQAEAVLRVPIDHGHEGKLFAIAVSPDGKVLAAGGWTGWSWDRKGSVYFFDIATGKLLRRFDHFANAISNLNWLPSGDRLLVGMYGKAGLQLIDSRNGSVIASDADYLDKILDVDVNKAGYVSAVALDGMIRLYDKDLNILGRRKLDGGRLPSSVRYSPDGKKIAVGFFDNPMVSIINGADLSHAYSPDLDDLNTMASFTTVAWSSDGDYLYAAGDFRGSGKNPIFRWAEAGRGKRETIPLTENRLIEIQTLAGGKMAFAAEDPGLGIIDAGANILDFKTPDILNFRKIGDNFQVAADGETVRYSGGGKQAADYTFSVFAPGDQNLTRRSGGQLLSVRRRSKAFDVVSWEDSYDIMINGKKPALEPYEMSRSYTVSKDEQRLLLGTEWGLGLYDRAVQTLWKISLPAVAWNVNISGNDQFALAALSDGTIRWYRMKDGKEVLAYFPLNNGKDWIAWIPEGYYMSSVYGDHYVGWHLNRDKDLAPDFFKAVQMDRFLYRPDVVKAAFRQALDDKARKNALDRLNADFALERLRKVAPPRLHIHVSGNKRLLSDGREKLTIEAEKTGLPIQDYLVFVNNIPVTPYSERLLKGGEANAFIRDVDLVLNRKTNSIRVEAFNGVSMGVAEAVVTLPEGVQLKPEKGDLYLVAVGANEFPKLPPETYLDYAAQDSEEFSQTAASKLASCYDDVHVKVLSDHSSTLPEKQKILQAFDFFNQAKPNDTVAIFLASHGVSDPAGNYYFVPRDSEVDDLYKVETGGQSIKSLLSWKVFFDALRNTTGRRLLIVDTCQAQNIQGQFESHSLMKRSASSWFSLVVASKGDEYSQEYSPGKHGLFTYALLKSLNTKADLNNNGRVSLQEWFSQTRTLVDQLREKQAGPQTPQIISPDPLNEMPLLCDVD